MDEIAKKRQELKEKFFPGGLPRLWCPPLTHYNAGGELDRERMKQHFRFMQPSINCFLAPGSTGDGWEMDDDEVFELLEFLLEEAQKHNFWIMIGALKTEKGAALEFVKRITEKFIGPDPEIKDFARNRICGFAVTPPRGRNISQKEIYNELAKILDTGYPLALYQLPQITENEFSPETFRKLRNKYANLFLVKDTSGDDRVVLSEYEPRQVFMVRGMEGDYAGWIKPKGPYDGLLLSTANCFPAELKEIIKDLENDKTERARTKSKRLTDAMDEIFTIVEELSFSNRFTNANKAIDHHLAYGSDARQASCPLSCQGEKFPRKVIDNVGEVLVKYDFAVKNGYLS